MTLSKTGLSKAKAPHCSSRLKSLGAMDPFDDWTVSISFSATGAATVLRHMQATSKRLEATSLRLASGSRVARTAFDAAGAQIASRMRVKAQGYGVAVRSIQDGISLLNTSEGGLEQAVEQLERIKELSLQAMTGTLSPEDRQTISLEVAARMNEFERITMETEYNDRLLLYGSDDITLQTWPDPGDNIVLALTGIEFVMTAMNGLDANTVARATTLHGRASTMVDRVMQIRTSRGATGSRLRSTLEQVRGAQIPLELAASRIADADYAVETADYTRDQLLQQAAVGVLQHALRSPNVALQLLRP